MGKFADALGRLADQIEQEEAVQSRLPVVHQVTRVALRQLWALLGVSNQTDAVQRLRAVIETAQHTRGVPSELAGACQRGYRQHQQDIAFDIGRRAASMGATLERALQEVDKVFKTGHDDAEL